MKKKMYVYGVIFATVFFLSFSQIQASSIEKAYESFTNKIKEQSPSQQQAVLRGLGSKLQDLSYQEKYRTYTAFFDQLSDLNNEKIFEIWQQQELSHTSQKKKEDSEEVIYKNAQKTAEDTLPEYIADLLQWSQNYEFFMINDQQEIYKDNSIYRLLFSEYFPISKEIVSLLQDKRGMIAQLGEGEYIFIENFELERKIPYSELAEEFVFVTPEIKFHQNNQQLYAYNFSKFQYYGDVYGLYREQLRRSWFSQEDTLIYRDEEWKYNFVWDYNKQSLVASNTVYGVNNKQRFLEYLVEDAKAQTPDVSQSISDISSQVEKLKKSAASEQDFIQKVYAWILDHTSYSSVVDLQDETIFSGIETYENASGVCTGYTKLMAYMLYLWGVEDVEVIRGHVIDADDFPEIGHAWIKIGDRYYDPTFDDPVWAQRTREVSQYEYFGLPRDVFYANRYEYGDLPDFLLSAGDTEISEHIYDNLVSILPKYERSLDMYPVFWEIQFREENGLSPSELLTPESLSEYVETLQVRDGNVRVNIWGREVEFRSIFYYLLDEENIENVLDILSYDFEDVYLLQWYNSDNSFDWRLVYQWSE